MVSVGSIELLDAIEQCAEMGADSQVTEAQKREAANKVWMVIAELFGEETQLFAYVSNEQLSNMSEGKPFGCLSLHVDGAGDFMIVGVHPDDRERANDFKIEATPLMINVHTLFEMVRSDEHYAGIIMNPWGAQLKLPKASIAQFLDLDKEDNEVEDK